MTRRTKFAIWAGAAAAALLIAAVMWAVVPSSNGLRSDSFGGLNGDLPGLPFHVEARPGSFAANHAITVQAADGVPDPGRGSLVATAVLLSSKSQPTYPLVIETTASFDIDPDLTVGVLWDEATGRMELIGIEVLADGRLRARIPHFTGFGILQFPSLIDLSDWLTGSLLQGMIDALADFFNAPYDCPTTKFDTPLLELGPYPDTVSLQLDVRDEPNIPNTLLLELCNRHRFPYEISASGAGKFGSFVFPRTTARTNIALSGAVGDPFVVDAKFSPLAVTLLVLVAALDAMPVGKSIMPSFIREGFMDPDLFPHLHIAAQSCAGSIASALATTGATPWSTAVACLANQEDFFRLAFEVFVKQSVALGLETAASAAAKQPHLRFILGSQMVVRLVLELVNFGMPKDVSFQYRLRCALPAPGGCGQRPSTSPTVGPVPGSSTPPPKAGVPAAPSNVVATAISPLDIRITWKDNSTNETRFDILETNGLSTYVFANDTSTDWSTGPGSTHCFRIRAVNASGTSASVPTQAVCATTPTASIPPPPNFVYPVNGQTLDLEGSYLFKVTATPNASGYLFGFFQNGDPVWENLANEGNLSGTQYGISAGSEGQSRFEAGEVEVWVRALVYGQWTEPRIIVIQLA